MDALNFLKFWRNTTTTSTTTIPHLVVETDSDSDEDDSFFDLELTLNNFDNKENNITNKTNDETKTEVNVPQKTTLAMSPNEPISKRKVLPIEPISKPQSPIALLRSAPSFRIFTFRKHKQMEPCEKNKVFAVKVNIEDFHCSPTLSRDNSTRSFGSSKVRNQCSEEQQKTERFSKDVMQKYLKMIKPWYDKVSKRNSEKGKFSGERMTVTASPSSSPSVVSVSSRKEKQGGFPAGMRVVAKHLGKSRSAGTVAGVGSPANRSDDTLLQHNDGIQSAILHCKRSFNSRDSSEGSMCSLRNSFEDERGGRM